MSVQIPSYEHPKLQSAGLRNNLKYVVETIKAINGSLAEIKEDTSGRDRSVTTTVLTSNLAYMKKWGKYLQENILRLEGKTLDS